MGTGRSVGALLALLGICAGIAAPAGASADRKPSNDGSGTVLAVLALKGTNGYEINVSAVSPGGGAKFPPTGIVAASRGPLRASYELPLESVNGIHADLGAVGAVALDFRRQKRTVERPEKGCTWITETGVFEGSFRFAGERGYTSAEATSAEGQVTRLRNGFCGFGDDRANPGVPDLLRASTLVARARIPGGVLQVGASELRAGGTLTYGASLVEKAGAVKITRSAEVSRGRSDGLLGGGKRLRSISVDPPAPFYGTARFRDAAGSPPTWTGSLSVSFPGAPGTALAGPGFVTKVCPSQSLFGECKVGFLTTRRGVE